MGGMTTPPQPPQYAPAPQPMNPSDEKMWATLIHVGAIIVSFWVPLIGYLVLKDRGPFIHQHTAAALNFHLTMLIALIAGVVLSFIGVGILLLAATYILMLIFGILAAIAANNGQYYRYPIAITFVN